MLRNCRNFAQIFKILTMVTNGNLHPVSDKHSVKEAVISFSVTPKITDVSAVEELLADGQPFCGRYQKFEPVNIREIKVNAKTNQTEVNDIVEKGFKLAAFESGKVSDIVQCIPQASHSILTFNTLRYKGWEEYLKNSLLAARTISDVNQGLRLSNISVMFVDEFYFEDKSSYNPKDIFNLESGNIPVNILESDTTDFNLSNHKKSGEIDYMENISIQVFNDMEYERKVIRITGNIMSVIFPVSFKEALDSDDVRKYLDFGHDKNKEMLRSILSETALKMIGL